MLPRATVGFQIATSHRSLVNATALFLLALHGALAQAATPMTVYYEERAPYQMRVGDSLEGLTGAPAARAFKGAQVAVAWENASMPRALHALKENLGQVCVVALFKTQERLAYAKYTKPLYRDGPKVILARRALSFAPGNTFSEALAAPEVRLLVRRGYSYGKYIDEVLLRTRPATIASAKSNRQIAELLVADRADMMIASEEETSVLLESLGSRASHLHVLRFPDLLPGEERHISCTRNVPDETIDHLNSVIDSWGAAAPHRR
jgi:polar amino acid transport system substrate-binding protein